MSAYAPQPSSTAVTPSLPDYSIGFVDAVKQGFRRYVAFDGRASRAEFWYWYLFVVGVLLILIIPSASIGSATASPDGSVGPVFVVGFVIAGLFYAAVLLPTIAVACRRLHDAGFSGLFLLLAFVTGLIPLIMCMLPTSAKAVQYGPPGTPGPPGPPSSYNPSSYGPSSYGPSSYGPSSDSPPPGSYSSAQPAPPAYGQSYPPGPAQPPSG